MALEWVKVYLPDIARVANYIECDVLKRKKRSGRQQGEPDNFMNAGFVNIGEGSRLGRLPKKARKKEDQKALSQLHDIGDVNEAKYRFVSTSFLERHGIGPYNVDVSEMELDRHSSSKRPFSRKNRMVLEEEEESDSGWILDALGVEKEEEEKSVLPFDTNVGVSVGSGGPSVSVGIQFNSKRGIVKKSSSQNLRDVLESSSSHSSKPKRPLKPHVSDNESGFLGRIRAQGANSVVGRSILGAYPGDLPSPDEAGDSRGVIDMAQRYGYGDWSDEDDDGADGYSFGGDQEDDDDEDHFFMDDEDEIRPKKRSTKRTKAKKRRSSSSRKQNLQSVEIGFDFGGSSSQESVPVSSVSSRKRRKRTTSVADSASVSSSLSGSRRRRKTRSSQLPSLAMEKLGNPVSTSTTSSKRSTRDATKSSSTSSTTKDIFSVADKLKSKTKRNDSLSPAMSLLNKAKQKGDATSSNKSENNKKDEGN